MTENKVGGYEGIRSGLQQFHIFVIASAARQSIAARITSSSQNLDRRVAQVLLAMTENKVGGYEGIRPGLQQIHIIYVIASAARQSITAHLTSSSRNLDRRVAQVLLAMTENKVGGYEGIRSGLQQIYIIYVIASAARQSITARITSSSQNLDRRVAQVLLAMTENNVVVAKEFA